jgi:hypothetical protein
VLSNIHKQSTAILANSPSSHPIRTKSTIRKWSSNNATPSGTTTGRSQAHLTRLFQDAFDKRQADRKEFIEETEATFRAFGKLVQGDPDIAKASEIARKRTTSQIPKPAAELLKRKMRTQKVSAQDVTRVVPFDWNWTWSATSGSAQILIESADHNTGNLSGQTYSGDNGGTGSVAFAVGVFYQPTAANGLLDISAIPSISWWYNTSQLFDGVHSRGFLGFYVCEYTLEGDFVQAVVDQQINLWDVSSHSSNSVTNSGFPLLATFPVDNNHFYEVWVRAGNDSGGVGGGFLNFSYSGGVTTVNVPEISIFEYSS